jgi:hypothetical protein
LTGVTAFGRDRLFTHVVKLDYRKYITLNGKVMMNDEFKQIWKEAVMAYSR